MPYNDIALLYDGEVTQCYVMKVSRNGQVSVPAEARARWQADRMVVVDLGDRIVMRPLTEGGVAGLVGKYAGPGPTTDELRRLSRADDERRARRGKLR